MVTYRLLEKRDTAAFLAWRGGDEYRDALLTDAIREHSDGKRFLCVALGGDAIIGTVTLVTTHSDEDLADGVGSSYVEALEVREAHRRQGIATGLMSYLQCLAEARGFTRLTVEVEPWNEPALRFFRGLMFQEYRNSVFCWRGTHHPVVCLEKSLVELTVQQAYSADAVVGQLLSCGWSAVPLIRKIVRLSGRRCGWSARCPQVSGL